MIGESIPIPAPRIEPVALETASSAKTVAGVLFFFVAVFVFAAVGMLIDGNSSSSGKHDGSSMVAGVLFWLVVIGMVAMRFVKTARCASAAAQRAKADPASQWFLSGKLIVGWDSAGTPRPELTFKISNKLRTMLLSVPRATIVDSHDHG
jgi:hypothetical protein